VKDALDSGTLILAGEIEITLALPPHVRFTFPTADADKA
jgi:hypothetical protein